MVVNVNLALCCIEVFGYQNIGMLWGSDLLDMVLYIVWANVLGLKHEKCSLWRSERFEITVLLLSIHWVELLWVWESSTFPMIGLAAIRQGWYKLCNTSQILFRLDFLRCALERDLRPNIEKFWQESAANSCQCQSRRRCSFLSYCSGVTTGWKVIRLVEFPPLELLNENIGS